ncbi:MAG: hypothetical protein CO189_00875 [candidate division Zixibacteria bacterium CG_4_9_14_3_um_filter_46_8]|nr:MAG: hypothetical protein CO189_00875 [candidate division Zixibacteria bacterium CG_4_9_14_3_um_filter_46_8]
MKLSLLFLLLIGAILLPAMSQAAIDIEFRVTEMDTAANESALVISDSIAIKVGNSYHIFTGPLTISIYPLYQAKDSIRFQVEIVTLSPNIVTASDEKTLTKGQQVSLKLNGKNGSIYEVMLRPLSQTDRQKPIAQETDANEESIHFIFSFKRDSMADYHLPLFGAYLEKIDKLLKAQFRFYYSDKIAFALYDKPEEGLYWDKTFPISFDPAHRGMAMIYSRLDFPKAATFLTAYLLYSNWGYSHPFLVWSAAGFIDEPHFFAMKQYSSGVRIDPQDYFKPRPEWKGDPDKYTPFIASFTKHLIEKFGIDRFKIFYQDCNGLTDLNDAMSKHFGQSYQSLKEDWTKMLAGYRPKKALIGGYAELQFDFMTDFKRALPIYEYLSNLKAEDYQSGLKYAMCLYNTGSYDEAAKIFEKIIRYQDTTAEYHYLLGNAYLSAGHIKKAEQSYERALQLDSTYSQAYLKAGQIDFYEGRTAKAERRFMNALGWSPDGGIYSDIYFEWAAALRALGNESKADSLTTLGLTQAKNKADAYPDILIYRIFLGEAYLNTNQPHNALSHLSFVELNETRPYYAGRTLLALGKTNDLLGERNAALQYYRRVINGKSGALQKNEAKELIIKPFHSRK